ncbi:pregnancy-specific beta-1-glycoprotein 7-like isoform X4 [Thunnus thynnus]|uniref:pregnancy-specific beta-1-glycoprotein 7-like isoform X4 n=1 Tax=Thunnus thynnus TaxID=8237 RepID=UPI00352869EF
MDEFRWIQMFLFLILELQITVTGQFSSVFVRDGDDATLPCENVTANQNKCDNTNWIYSGSNPVDLVKRGQIHENTEVKSDRLSVTANCSLVIKKITQEDVGVYYCQQDISGQDSQVVLSVINMNKHEDSDYVTLTCSVWTHDSCIHTVKWLYEGHDVDEDVKILQNGCYGLVRFPASHLKLKSTYHRIFQFKVTDGYTNKEHLFTFSPPSSGDKTTTATTEVTTRTTVNNHKPRTNSTEPTISDTPTPEDWWWYIIAAVGLAALLIIVVVVIRRKRTTGNKTQTDEDTRLTINPAVTQSAPETSQDTADPEDGVSYASISYTKKTNSEARVSCVWVYMVLLLKEEKTSYFKGYCWQFSIFLLFPTNLMCKVKPTMN